MDILIYYRLLQVLLCCFSDMFAWHLGYGWSGGVLSDAWQLHEISRRFAARLLRHGPTVFWGSYENLQLLVPSQRSRRSPSCKGPLTPRKIESEREFFLWTFLLLMWTANWCIPFAFEFECNRSFGNSATACRQICRNQPNGNSVTNSRRITIRPITLKLKRKWNLIY